MDYFERLAQDAYELAKSHAPVDEQLKILIEEEKVPFCRDPVLDQAVARETKPTGPVLGDGRGEDEKTEAATSAFVGDGGHKERRR